MKQKISKKEYKEVIDEVLRCQKVLEKDLGKYTTNAITRLVMARIKLEHSTIQEETIVSEKTKEEK
jgi:hypothetical protein